MKDDHILAGKLHFFAVENVAVLKADVILFVEETLLLNAGHVKHVELVDYGVEAFYNFVLNTGRLKNICNKVVRNTELLWTYENVFISFEVAEGFGKRVDGAAELKVAAEADGQVVESPLLALDGEQVRERLRRVVVAAVTGVDDGDLGVHGGDERRALFRVAHGDDVGIAADGADGIGDALALRRRRAAGGREAEDLAAEREHGGLEAQARPGRGLKEQRGEDLAVALVGIGLRAGDDVVGLGDQFVDLLGAELQNVDQVVHISLFLQSKIRPRGHSGTAGAGRRPRV